MAHVALIDVLDRDGQVRQTWVAAHWPLRIGRALDNDLVLSDPHVAAHHCTVDRGHINGMGSEVSDELGGAQSEGGVVLTVGESRNGMHAATAHGKRHLRAGQQHAISRAGDAGLLGVELTVGLTRLRLRLPEFALAPELPFTAQPSMARRLAPIAGAAAVLLAALLFNTYLASDPDTLLRATGSMLTTSGLAIAVWCSAWALLSKTFTHQARFLWHVRVFLFAAIALFAVDTLPDLASFVFSVPWPADFAFIGTVAVAATALYFHLLAVEPARRRLLRWMTGAGAAAAVLMLLATHVQRTDRLGDELYMSHLFPPSWRLAKPVASAPFIDGLAQLKPLLDKQATARGGSDAGDTGGSDED